jgi:hypothetical protein
MSLLKNAMALAAAGRNFSSAQRKEAMAYQC